MDRQNVQLALPWRGTSPSVMSTQPNDARSVHMCRSLYRAVCKGRIEEVKALLLKQHGAAANDKATGRCCNNTVLHIPRVAVKWGAPNCFPLARRPINQHERCDIIESTAAERNTVLHVAAEKGHHDLIQEVNKIFSEKMKGLLSRRNSAQDTPLHCAARAGSDKAVAVLVELAQDYGENILGCKNEAGDTPLHLAARYGHVAAVKELVSAAPMVAAELNNAHVSPLYLAVMSGSVDALRAIISTCEDASSVGPNSQNALHAAVFQRKSSEMVELLLGWRPTLADEVDCGGSSPLHFASSDGDLSIIRAILRDALPGTVYKKDSSGLSALHVAARMGYHRVVKEMLQSCPDAAEIRDNNGRTFLHAAAQKKCSSVVSLTIKDPMLRGKDPMLRGLLDAQDRDGNTPLHLAVAEGAYSVVETLIRKGKVRVDVLNNKGQTPFDSIPESSSYFTMVSLVVMLVVFKAQPQPQRQDHLKPWSGHSIVQGIEKTSDSLTVVAVLIATAAFAAGFNLPGGYDEETGKAKLLLQHEHNNAAFKCFLFLDTVAVAMSVVAAILLVYGKASCSAGSWKSFVASLHCMWVSLISLMLAFYASLVAVASRKSEVYNYALMAIQVCIQALILWITTWVAPATKSSLTNWRFLWQCFRSKGRHVIKRQYPLAGASIPNLFLFTVTNFIASIGFLVLSFLSYES